MRKGKVESMDNTKIGIKSGNSYRKLVCGVIFTVCSHTFIFCSRKIPVSAEAYKVRFLLLVYLCFSSGDLFFCVRVFPFYSCFFFIRTSVLSLSPFSCMVILFVLQVCVKFLEVSNNWSGVIRFGFTCNDPNNLRYGLPKYACPGECDVTQWHDSLPWRALHNIYQHCSSCNLNINIQPASGQIIHQWITFLLLIINLTNL